MKFRPTIGESYRSAIEQLWRWLEEQSKPGKQVEQLMSQRFTRGYYQGSSSAYSNVKLYMRKFFSGLIDFDGEEE